MVFDLREKVALVTGGAGGIGEEVVKLLRTHGARVASVDLAEHKEPADDTFLPLKASIASEDDCNSAIQKVIIHWGRIDILVNNAGVMDNMAGVADTSNKLWQLVIDVNLNGPMYLMRSAIPLMQKNLEEHKGVIVNVASVSALRGAVSGAAYSTAKAGLAALGRNTAWVYRHEGIRCSTVMPGGVVTNIIKNSNAKYDKRDIPQKQCHDCMPGMVSALDVAEGILYLITATGVNGEELVIDRGWMMA
ncbi:NAD(P)-binding protein [Pyrenochaeta sp. DS3sAY3a]|nr:NAD(P)-binding protein [Pyrenochaeta sp. DS3sAY3a]